MQQKYTIEHYKTNLKAVIFQRMLYNIIIRMFNIVINITQITPYH